MGKGRGLSETEPPYFIVGRGLRNRVYQFLRSPGTDNGREPCFGIQGTRPRRQLGILEPFQGRVVCSKENHGRDLCPTRKSADNGPELRITHDERHQWRTE